MNFIMYINELFGSEPYKLDLVEQSDNYWKYTFKTDKYDYIVEFKNSDFGWHAQHSTTNKIHRYLTYDNTLKVTKTIIDALKDFLEKKKPECVILEYIPTDDDRSKKLIDNKYVYVPYNIINKRARLQQNYLKNLDGYKIKYYYNITGSFLIKTIGLIYRNDLDINHFDKHFFHYNFTPVE